MSVPTWTTQQSESPARPRKTARLVADWAVPAICALSFLVHVAFSEATRAFIGEITRLAAKM